MIRNIVLDMGNVLLDFNPEVSLNRYCSSDEERNSIRKELFQGPEWLMGDRGDIRDADRFDLVKLRVPERFHGALKACADHWDICMKPIEGAAEFCRDIKEAGYGIYILSNASDAFYRYFPAFLPLAFFDGVFVSSDYRMVKPDEEIYRTFLCKYGLVAEECLFIDDREDNLIGARKTGMQTFRFSGDYEAVRKIVEEKGAIGKISK